MKENPLKPIEGVGLEVLRKPNGDDDKGSSQRSALQRRKEKKYFFLHVKHIAFSESVRGRLHLGLAYSLNVVGAQNFCYNNI